MSNYNGQKSRIPINRRGLNPNAWTVMTTDDRKRSSVFSDWFMDIMYEDTTINRASKEEELR